MGLFLGFLEGYKSMRAWRDKYQAQKAGIHAAVHLMYWPTVVSWGDEQETKEIVTLGWRLLQKSY